MGLNLIQHPLLVCGVHRSGTTLLRNLLDGHPALTTLPSEGSFLTNFASQLDKMPYEKRESFLAIRWIRRLANPINQPPYWSLGTSSEESSPYVDFARGFSAWYRITEKSFPSEMTIRPHFAVILAYATCSKEPDAGLAASYWVDKTPTLEKYHKKILRELPQARIIHMLRSPADVFLSRKRMEPSLNLKVCLQDMRLSYRIALEQSLRNKHRYLVVRYEALCANPQSVVSEVTEFLNIEQHSGLFIPTVAGKPAHVNSSFSAALPPGDILKPRTSASPADLSNQEDRLLSAFLFKSASGMGYPLKSMGKFQTARTRILFAFHHRIVSKFNVLKFRLAKSGNPSIAGP
ncbi:MAG TPA: sulfotransferase [Puia sp.]|nr:sulfotransferase [Puia sp.]